MAEAWRWIVGPDAPSDESSGPWNMGVDEALLSTAAAERVCAVRLYEWRGAWLSLGYAQRVPAGRLEACRSAGVGVVRRATGGRAVLHGCDLTYAVAAPNDVLPPGLRGAYDAIARILVDAFRRVGLEVARSAPDAPPPRPDVFDCFEVAAADEICVGGRKLAGSAQRRVAGAMLQHGSIRLRPDAPEQLEAAGLPGAGATSLLELGFSDARARLEEALAAAFAAGLGTRLEASELRREEAAYATERCQEHAFRPLGAPAAAAEPLGIGSRAPVDGR